jgi:hypothetical protein
LVPINVRVDAAEPQGRVSTLSLPYQLKPALLLSSGAPGSTQTTLAASATSATYGQPVTFTATVAPATPVRPTPTGTVQFFVDNAPVGDPVGLVDGVAVDSTIILDAGTHTVTATYLGAPDFTGSPSNGVTETVAPAPLVVTANNATRGVAEPDPGFSATISGFVLNQGTADLGGKLNFTTTATAASPTGSYAIIPGGLVSNNYAITYAAGTLAITPASTSNVGVTITTAPGALPHDYGTPLAFTATVTATAPGAPTPTGTIQFAVDGVAFGSPVMLVGGATTSAPIATLVPGTHTISAAYSGDANYPARGSANVPVVIAPTPSSVIVTVLFRQLLNHSPDPASLAMWTGQLNSGIPAAVVASKINQTKERRMLIRKHLAKSNVRSALAAALRASKQNPLTITGVSTPKFTGFVDHKRRAGKHHT